MKQDCRNDCVEALQFPKAVRNRPGLSHIGYRIGTFSDFLEAMMQDLNRNDVLQAWTHRGPDDPGIALLEGASILGDILTFYQELYANEAYLRTARWRESIADLVRLVGYRLSPGLGGRATFAFEVKGDKPVVIPAGFPIKAQLEGLGEPAEFETVKETVAYPALSKFHLYRRRWTPQPITVGLNQLEIQSVNGHSDAASIKAVDVKAGDRIVLVPDASMYDITGTPYATQQKAEILIVSEVQRVLDRTTVKFEGALTQDRGTQVIAYRIGRSFRHFGHNAPAQLTTYDESAQAVTQVPTRRLRCFWGTFPVSPGTLYYSTLLSREMPLDEEVDDLSEGGKMVCQGRVTFYGPYGPEPLTDEPVPLTVVRGVESVEADSLVWGNLSGPSTVVTLSDELITNEAIYGEGADICSLRFHEVTSAEMSLRAPTKWDDYPFADVRLNYHGTYDEVIALAGRQVLIEGQTGTCQRATVASKKSDYSLYGKDKSQKWLWTVALDKKPEPFVQKDFDEKEPRTTVYGNLVEATQGKTEREAVLGNGDSRQTFQTFKLPKAPLTYHNLIDETPPEVPELEIYVDDLLWTRVPSFFDRGPDEEIYVVREDAEGSSWVQFGDGTTGKRLPSGVKNMVAKYRTGIGAYGALKEETTVQAGGKLKRLERIQLPGVATGGSDPESGDTARQAAPGKVQSLGRLVSLKDFESETLAISGVSKASAVWGVVKEIPTVVLTVLMETGRDQEFGEVQEILAGYNRRRGPQRFPIKADQGWLSYVYIAADVVYDPTLRQPDVLKAIKEALGLAGEEGDGIDGSKGLFALGKRLFGEDEYATTIEGIIQNVKGVQWTKVTHLLSLDESEDPSQLDINPSMTFDSKVECLDRHVLGLYSGHLQLSPVSGPATEVC